MTEQNHKSTGETDSLSAVPPTPEADTGTFDFDDIASQEEVRQTGTYYAVPPRPAPKKSGGIGCWLTALASLFFAAILVGVGLFLPPISLYDRLFGTQYTPLSSETNALQEDGITFAVYSESIPQDYGVALTSSTMNSFLASTENSASAAAIPPNLALQSAVYTIETTGSQPADVTLAVDIPASAPPADLLDMYGFDAETNTWNFIASHPTGSQMVASVSEVPDQIALFQTTAVNQPRVVVSVSITQELTSDVANLATIIAPAGLQPTIEGSLTGSLAAGFDLNANYLVMPSIRNYVDSRATDPDTIIAILSNRELRARHAAQLAAFASSGYDGVVVDYRDLPTEQRANFSAFIENLRAALGNSGLYLGVVVPAAENITGEWDTGAYDWAVIGSQADFVQIALPIDPLAYAPGSDRVVEAMLRWAVGQIERSKIVAGLSTLSIQQTGDNFTPIGFDQALAALGNVDIEAQLSETGTIEQGAQIQARLDGLSAIPGVDQDSAQPYIEYTADGQSTVTRMWLTTPEALRARMDRTLLFTLSGVGFEDLLESGVANGILNAILDYKLQLPTQVQARQLALRWTIEGVDGILSEVTTGLNEALVATIEAPDGNYAINVAVIDESGAESQRAGVAVALFAPTNTPTPVPTATPTPTPQPTTVPVQQQAPVTTANTSGNSGGGAVAVNNAGAIVGGSFEYGGHVTSTATGASGQMRSAGMNWMKEQVRVSQSCGGFDIAANAVANARAQGFKVLLGLVGSPGELGAGGDGYIQGFANCMGQIASLGPDAMEIWNEANIDREWPTGQISGEFYVRLLAASYNAIKATNGNVMVISAAPAPTGAEAAFPGQVMNDDNWLRQVVNAGGLNYMDCVGAHYNEGITSPAANGGDPRDNYYTRYFLGMLNTYWGITGGQRQICFTELGFLTPEGFPPLPAYFSWAQNVSLSQQAAWLAEAAALASQSGRVRLMIIWNIDFSNYGDDPMAGYAIIRPGGGCPACSSLASAR